MMKNADLAIPINSWTFPKNGMVKEHKNNHFK